MAEPAERSRTPLLELVTRESMDLDYEIVAQRRTGDPTRSGPTPHRGAAVAVAVFGLLVAVAAVQTSRNSGVAQANRVALTERIDARQDAVASLTERIATLRSGNANLAEGLTTLTTSTRSAEQLRDTLALNAGFAAAEGPGVRVTVADEPQGSADGLVRATDLSLLINGLWEAGAEAISINGRRLTAVSALVNADIAIQVNKGPLSPPYVIRAIGGPDLQADLLGTQAGLTFFALARQFGFVVQRENVVLLELSAAPASMQRLRYATRPKPVGTSDQEEAAP